MLQAGLDHEVFEQNKPAHRDAERAKGGEERTPSDPPEPDDQEVDIESRLNKSDQTHLQRKVVGEWNLKWQKKVETL